MEDRIALLKDYILEAPAPNSEHRRQIEILEGIIEGYKKEIAALRAQLKENQEE